jgi:hypothetical protein
MIKTKSQSGFSAVELLITLFIAFLFIMMGYQLYSVAMQGGGESRTRAHANDYAYTELRFWSSYVQALPASFPCSSLPYTYDVTSSHPTLYPGVKSILMTYSCPSATNLPNVRMTTIKLQLGSPVQEVTHAVYVSI